MRRQRYRDTFRPVSREDTHKFIDHVMGNAPAEEQPATRVPRDFPSQPIGRRRRHRKELPTPFELLAMLTELCMDRLSANAWKVICYVAVRMFRDEPQARNAHIRQTWDKPVAITLREFSQGVRQKRKWRDYGTGLSKSSIAEAINEAIWLGILQRERRTRANDGGTIASTYAIDWAQVRQWDEVRQRTKKR